MTTVVNFVCDRLPDQDGCRFIELENDRGESVGAGEWHHRDDGLVELRVALSQPPIIQALHDNAELIALQATVAQQAQMIEHLRGGPTPLYTAVDMANAARDGFRDGRKSVGLLLGKGFNTLETEGSKYKIVMQFAGHDDAWAAYTELATITGLAGEE